MRTENSLRRALEADEAVLGAAAATFSPTVIEVLGDVGLDFVWLDFEHGGPSPHDSTVFEDLTRAAEAGDIELLVRLPAPEPNLVRKVLDAGVRTVLLPRIETATELRRAVEAAHFSYEGDVGDRGIGIGRTGNWAGYEESDIASDDEQVLVGTMIENRRAVENIDEILSVPKLGFAFVGPADLGVSMSGGKPGSHDAEALEAAIDTVREACLDADVPIGRIRNDPETAREAIQQGYQIVRIGGDVSAIRTLLRHRLAELGED
jgi:2-dehydro-3-deoxyglucarate aldolase